MNNTERIFNQITADLAMGMFKLLQDFPGYEAEIVRLMTAQLGSLIAVATKDPAQALIFYANRLAHFDWATVRSDYFANTLGVQSTRPAQISPLAEVHSLDDRRSDPVRTDPEAGNAGDPRAKKPE